MKFLFIGILLVTNLVYADSLDGNDPSLKVIQILDKGLIQEHCHDDHGLRQSSDDRLVIKDAERYNRSPAVDKLFIKRIMKQSIQE